MATNRRIQKTRPASQEALIQGNALQVELSAMQDIAAALDRLDESTRTRVLRWAEERFQVSAALVTAPAPLYVVPGLRPKSDPDESGDESLSVSSLDDFFVRRGPKALKKPVTEVPGQSVNGMLQDFVADFQDVVREWNMACDGPADERTAQPLRSIAS